MLVDTAVWVDHLRRGDPTLAGLLEQMQVSVHPFVIGELACGYLTDRARVLESMASLPRIPVIDHAEVLDLVETHRLMGRGLGWVDMHLLAAARAAAEQLLTRDQRLHEAAVELGLV